MEFNERKFTFKELAFAHRYLAQEGSTEYANSMWQPDPELSAFLNEMTEAST
jgi:hypothetical protein